MPQRIPRRGGGGSLPAFVTGRGVRLRRRGALVVALALLGREGAAGEWHADGTLACSDCHTMHNAKDGQPMRYDSSATPASLLLRAANATALCLACHGGQSPTSQAPAVTPASNGDPPGGGFPPDLSDPSHTAHSLGATPVFPPDGDTAVVMTCVTCHAPHGNAAYRNLRASPSGTGRSSAAPAVAQLATADGTNADVVYTRSNVRYVSGTSQWCLDCHNALPAAHGSLAHPWDVLIFGAPAASWTAWSAEIANRVPVENPLGLSAAAPNEGDRVSCLSCHKAHGSPNASALIHADGTALSSTCQQCHDM